MVSTATVPIALKVKLHIFAQLCCKVMPADFHPLLRRDLPVPVCPVVPKEPSRAPPLLFCSTDHPTRGRALSDRQEENILTAVISAAGHMIGIQVLDCIID